MSVIWSEAVKTRAYPKITGKNIVDKDLRNVLFNKEDVSED